MQTRKLGETGLLVSVVGLGAGRIGGDDVTDAQVDALVGGALDLGVTLIDTARSYGESEARLGRALQGRRDRVVLSTKVGYGVPGIPDWTAEVIGAGVDAALRRLHTDRLDLVHLHSCGVATLEHSGVVEALARTVEQGKVRVAAYSGEGDALAWAVRSGAFGAVQCSVSAVDQGAIDGPVAEAHTRGIGVLGKRALGNAPWRSTQRPPETDVAEAWDRFRALALDARGLGWPALFARFAAFAPGVSAILSGTATLAHLAGTAAAVAQGPLEAGHFATLRASYLRLGARWPGRV